MINRTQFGIDEDVPLYNIRIIRTHIDYVNKVYPSISIDDLLNYAGITSTQ